MSLKKERFTLIELTVIIAIIVILVALLIPTLSNVKSLAKRSLCVSNQRQISMCMQLYASDYSNHLIPVSWNNPACVPKCSHPAWYDICATLYGKNDYGIYRCTDSPKPRVEGGKKANVHGYAYRYQFVARSGETNIIRHSKYSDILRPSVKMLLADTGTNLDGGLYWISNARVDLENYSPGAGATPSGIAVMANGGKAFDSGNETYARDFMRGRHNLSNTTLFMDLHVEPVDAWTWAWDYYSLESNVGKNGPLKWHFTQTSTMTRMTMRPKY